MSDTTFVNGTVVEAAWLNDVNDLVYSGNFPTAGQDVTVPDLIVTGTTVLTGSLTANGNVVLGNASGDTLTVAPNAVTWSNNPTHSGNHTFTGALDVQNNVTLGSAGNATLDHSQGRFHVTNGGLVYGNAIHNNVTSPTGTTNQPVGASGTYTPIALAVTNVASVTGATMKWIRTGNVVSFSGGVTIDPISGNTLTSISFSLPIASVFASSADAHGVAQRMGSGVTSLGGYITANITDNILHLHFNGDADADSRGWYFVGSYVVL